jgi:hypothetical protein
LAKRNQEAPREWCQNLFFLPADCLVDADCGSFATQLELFFHPMTLKRHHLIFLTPGEEVAQFSGKQNNSKIIHPVSKR